MTDLVHTPDALRTDTAPPGEGWARLWPLAGRAAAQGFYIAVTLFVFSNLQDRTETITVALIGLVFASLRASTLAGACTQRRVALLLENEIRSVRQAMVQELHSRAIPAAAIDRSLDALTKALRIEYAGLAMISGICLYHLGIATLYGAAYQELLGLH